MDHDNNLPPSKSPVDGTDAEDHQSAESPESPDARNGDDRHSGHIRVDEPKRPTLTARNTLRGQSRLDVGEALRLERSRQEQETLLGADEEADDDGCYPPRTSDEPRAPNPHKFLPVYATIHKIRRLVIASIGKSFSSYGSVRYPNILAIQTIPTRPTN